MLVVDGRSLPLKWLPAMIARHSVPRSFPIWSSNTNASRFIFTSLAPQVLRCWSIGPCWWTSPYWVWEFQPLFWSGWPRKTGKVDDGKPQFEGGDSKNSSRCVLLWPEVCGNVLADVGLFSLALVFLILMFATAISPSQLNARAVMGCGFFPSKD